MTSHINGSATNGHHHSATASSSATKKRSRDEERLTPSSASSSSSAAAPVELVVDDSPDVFLPSSETAAILEEYRVWKKNSPYLYDIVISSQLDWPSLTVQFLPDRHRVEQNDDDYAVQRILLGTQTDGSERNYLMIAEVKLPAEDAVIDAEDFSKQPADHERVVDATASPTREPGGWGAKGKSGKIEVVQRIPHPSEVNRARYMPQNADVIATRGVDGDLYVFDRTRYASKPVEGEWKCDVLLRGHDGEGYGMSWSVLEEGRLVSCASDGKLCVWDINGGREKETKVLKASSTWSRAHQASGINDVSLHFLHSHLLASCADDGLVKCWDMRLPTDSPATHTLSGHAGPVNSAAFSPLTAFLLASAGDDHTVKVWDTRKPSSPLHSLAHHHDSIMQVTWAPFDDSVLSSSSADRRVNVYDLSRDPAGEGGQLLFMHGGHTDKVGEMSWNPVEGEEWMMATVSDNNIVQVWQVAENVYDGDDQDEEDDGTVEEQVKKSKAN